MTINKVELFYLLLRLPYIISLVRRKHLVLQHVGINGPGQVVKLSTRGRLAASLRAAGHLGWCVFVSECYAQDTEG